MSKSVSDNGKHTLIRKIDKGLLNVENTLAGIAYAIMVVVVFVGVILRYVVKTPNLYGEEISRYLMVMCVFLGIAAGCRQKVHLSVEMFVDMFPKPVRKAIQFIVRTLVVLLYGYLTYAGFTMVQQMKMLGQTSPAMRLPMWIMYGVIALGFLLSLLTEIILYINDLFCHGSLINDEKEEINL